MAKPKGKKREPDYKSVAHWHAAQKKAKAKFHGKQEGSSGGKAPKQ